MSRYAFRLPFKAEIFSKTLVAQGGYSDLWAMRTKHLDHENVVIDKRVYAVKEVRCLVDDPVIVENIFTILRARAPRLFLLDSDKVAQFLGLLKLESGRPAIVQQYYMNGNIVEFLQSHPDADKLTLIKDSVEAIKYLHEENIDHGNICPKAFLIANNGKVLVSDPGFHCTLRDILHPGGHMVSSEWPFKPREELEPTVADDLRPSKPKDVYSTACVVLDICGGRIPGYGWHYRGIMFIINNGHIAMQQPAQINNPLWGILQLCWDRTAANRPTMGEVGLAIQQLTSVD